MIRQRRREEALGKEFFKDGKAMLLLSRKKSERIRIGDNIVVTVVEVTGHCVRLSIEAPRHIRMLRSELLRSPTERSSPGQQEAKCRSEEAKKNTPSKQSQSATTQKGIL